MRRDNDVVEDSIRNEENSTSVGSGVPPAKVKPLIDILHEDVNAAVDIVAVHGLGATPDYAWVWLPKNNPPEAPQQRLSNISDNLLNSLRNNREVGLCFFDYQQQITNNLPNAIDRPLIFIGHSFGGNLIEQAIVSSRLHSEYRHIAESTVGVIFLGTPHRGSEAAKWGVLIASLGEVWGSTEQRILKDLQKQSGTLTDRLHDFSSWLFSESVPVVCYWEQLETDYSARARFLGFMKSILKEMVVDEASACIDGHKKISLHTDHFKINKFYGKDDPSFLQVYPEIVRMAECAEEMLRRRRSPKAIPDDRNAQPGHLLQFLRAMKVTNAKDALSEIKRRKGGRVENTCGWILRREEFSAWGAAADPQLFFITGSPGIGKTMMSTFLVDELQKKVERAPGKSLAYFFCDDKDQDRKTPIAILRSLIWQILLQRNELFDNIKADFDAQGNTIVESFSTLWRILECMLRDERAGEVFILIDALDDESIRNELLICIRGLFQSSPTAQAGNFKFFVTSRPEGDILEELGDVGTRLLMNSASVNDDLSKYIDSEVDRLAERKKYSLRVKAMVATVLKKEAEGTFLWVSLMIADLGKELRMSNVERKLNRLPKGLNETYSRILNENISEEMREDAQFLLLSMVAARRPLKKKEIASAFAVWKDGRVLPREDLDKYMDIYLSCGSIIYLDVAIDDDDTTINFCHQSVKDFLLDHHGGSAWYHTSRDHSNLLLFQVCWNYLNAETLNHCNLIVLHESHYGTKYVVEKRIWELSKHFQEYSLLWYAFQEWKHHAIASIPTLLDIFRINYEKEPVASYPSVLRRLTIDVADAPTLREALLLYAAKVGQDEIITFLHEQGANLNIQERGGNTPLLLAAIEGHEGIARLLLETGKVEANWMDEYGRSPLAWAAWRGHEAVTRLFLNIDKVEANSRDISGRSPLSLAAQRGHEAVTRLFLDIDKVKADLRDKDGRSPLSLAAECGHEAVTRLLLDTGKVEADSRDKDGRSPLSWAAEAVTWLLLDTGKVEADSRDKDGWSPLSWAAEGGHEAIVRLLLSIGKAEADSRDKDGRSPLSWAAEGGHEAVTRLLLDIGKVEADSRDKDSRSPLSWAAEGGHEAVTRLLLDTGKVEADSRDKNGRSPLWWAVGDREVGRRTRFFNSPTIDIVLQYPPKYNNRAVAKLLLDTGKVESVLLKASQSCLKNGNSY
ncbi:hypothetical protein V502_04720 [Pseudogymnoascus sp. VKM F-4520 (FW-2644)]|nr:hypothetical protein V502_04720 [Pseudogymnoascus sp. VKM F-4520 (FW-2644)]